ncbi:MAG: winged helix-turn-helix transcriptional regulator [Chloroflexi bacterium]|nr:winged helix-turn-helix transcriptional regulator [Chloroflexota bacterium]
MSRERVSAETTGIGRVSEVCAILERLAQGRCCSLVSVNNMGKTVLLRALVQRSVLEAYYGARAAAYLVVYVDCNRMLQLSEQGFYELLLRCLRELPAERFTSDERAQLDRAYEAVIQPSSPLAMPLAFSRALGALLDDGARHLAVLLDEFDEPVRTLDGRVLLNLRALVEQYPQRVVYVTATGKPLDLVRGARDDGTDEFCELFAGQSLALGPLSSADSARLLEQPPAAPAWSPTLAARLIEQSGGHPGLLRAAMACAAQSLTEPRGELILATAAGLAATLDQDPAVHTECARLWDGLATKERRTLEDLLRASTSRQSPAARSLMQKGLLRVEGARLLPFAPVWERYVLQQMQARTPMGAGVRIDADSSEVWVNGRAVPPLTPLEHALLLSLYRRAGQVCSKQQLVEAVYGRAYIESDVAALQRLVHRLRRKIEPDPDQPEHILSVRGYGYRLVAGEPS